VHHLERREPEQRHNSQPLLRFRFLGRHARTFELRGTLPGVGEALKREIAGLGLVGRLLLWGFGLWACLGSGLTDPLNEPR
jgi:hypothetical protein